MGTNPPLSKQCTACNSHCAVQCHSQSHPNSHGPVHFEQLYLHPAPIDFVPPPPHESFSWRCRRCSKYSNLGHGMRRGGNSSKGGQACQDWLHCGISRSADNVKGAPTYGTQLLIAHGVVVARKPRKQLCDAPCRRSCCGVPCRFAVHVLPTCRLCTESVFQ